MEVLSLIPTYLSSHNDRLRASFVCRHWRRSFLQYNILWSELFLSRGKSYVKTFLERAKRSMLDIFARHSDPVSTWVLLSSHTKKIRCLDFVHNESSAIQMFADIVSGPLPLLHTLTIKNPDEGLLDSYYIVDRPSPSLFSNATNLRVFRFHSEPQLLGHFVFPSLVSFEFSWTPQDWFSISQLQDFLEASPMLQIVHMSIITREFLLNDPQDRIAVLPSVEIFTLVLGDSKNASRLGYKIAAHLSCPLARSTSFVHRGDTACDVPPRDIFPDPVAWSAIISQYLQKPIEEVTLEITTLPSITCKLTLRSSDAKTIELCFKTYIHDESNHSFEPPTTRMHNGVFSQAVRTIRDHPQRENIKRLRICHSFRCAGLAYVPYIANEVRKLFSSLSCLDELTIYHCNLQPYIFPFLDEEEGYIDELFPPIKEFKIFYPTCLTEGECSTIVKVARSQHVLKQPFERVVIRGENVPEWMEEDLAPWVGKVESFHESD